MHNGCGKCFDNGKQVADKVRMRGLDRSPMPIDRFEDTP
jgi:hypothetical protein